MGLGSLYGENDLLDLDGDPQKERQVAEKQLAQLKLIHGGKLLKSELEFPAGAIEVSDTSFLLCPPPGASTTSGSTWQCLLPCWGTSALALPWFTPHP